MVEPGADVAGLRQELGALLRRLRQDAGKTLETLSRDLDRCGQLANEATSRTSLSRIEKGEQAPTEAVVNEILTATAAGSNDTREAQNLLQRITTASNTRPYTPPPADETGQLHGQTEPPPPPLADGTPDLPAGRSRKRWLISIAGIVVLAVAGGLFSIFQPWASKASSRSCVPTSTEAVTGTPSSTAVSNNSAASADFYRSQGRFVLTDERADSRSAVLLARINGRPQEMWSNCYGKTGRRRKDGIVAPPKIITLPRLDKNARVEFKTCVADNATQIIDGTCGDSWTVDQPR